MSRREEVPTLVVGAGPVGTTAAILLAQQGLGCHLLERRDRAQEAPAAHVVNARTFEILRATGVDPAALAAASQDPADGGQVLWVTTLAGEELGRLPFERQGPDVESLTPTPLRNLSQHRLEPILHDHARKHGVEPAFRHEWLSAEQDAAGVVSRVRALDGGAVREIRSRWLIAADGAGSRARKALGIEAQGPPRLASFVMIHFEAALRPLVGHRPAVLYWTTRPGAAGAFVAHDLDADWVFMHAWDPDRERAEDYSEARCAAIVRAALGTDEPAFRIRTIRPWHMSAQVAERYREGRIFLVGDSAHRFPPTGGLGLNTGIQDAHNLAWKLAAVEAGRAGAALLDSYEAERRPIARENADVSLRNALRLFEVPRALGVEGDPDGARARHDAALADPEARARVRAAIANQAEHFDMLGLQLGFCYETGALVPDGSARPAVANPVREHVPCGRPGARLPHAWVDGDGRRRSTLDLLPPDRFSLVVGTRGDAWCAAAAALPEAELGLLVIGRDVPDPEGAWASQLGIAPEGALLVRPDQHVAWRAARAVADPRAALAAALARVLGV